MKKKYSIVLTVYNSEKYLEKCLESIEKQTYNEWELILVNDGSTDQSGRLAREFETRINFAKSNRTVVYLEHENMGAVFSRERGICAASGDYILFIDSDDWWESTLIESVDRIVEETDADIIQYGYNFVDEKGKKINELGVTKKGGNGKNKSIIEYDSNIFSYKAITICYSLWSRAIRRSLFDKEEGYYKHYYKIDMTNDLLAFARPLSIAKSYCFSDIYPYNYRILNSSLCHAVSIHKIGSYCESLGWSEKCLRDRNGLTNEHIDFFTERIKTVLFEEYRGIIYSGSVKDIKYVYKSLDSINDIDTYIMRNYVNSCDWYEKVFLRSLIKRWIMVPKILWRYTELKNKLLGKRERVWK